MLKQLKTAIFKHVLPVNCLNCDLESDWLCPDCLSSIKLARFDSCALCHRVAENGLCKNCRTETGLKGLVTLYRYKKPIDKVIKSAKYSAGFDALRFLIKANSGIIFERLPRGDFALVPIPLHKNKLRKRGFNQSDILAKALSCQYLPIKHLLVRFVDTEAQASLSELKRKKNMIDCFKVKGDVEGKNIILIDDVTTTGSTLKEAAFVLKLAGAKSVWGFAIAHG